ncbi:hypothetical protein [Candidatus Thiodictyon syntrophicum]|uniref:hypothetical protein n=1 Tax=Candidatus Thiodictyon syntrophicum TaxID=1166950 RepID=UPI0012FD1878|nr:hypothetical protein [Candidatus Thiodictyon syntrophicum]
MTAYVLYGGRLYRDNFEVQAHGMVDMISDKLLADAPPAQIERFDGPIRLPPVDAPPDPQKGPA